MPSWNIHTAHVERLLNALDACAIGIEDANAFLFGNYVPDIYVGFMVPDASFRIDYCLTHSAMVETIPLPDADRFWDKYIARRKPSTPVGMSLVLGAWAHLVTDRLYNGRFRAYWQTHDVAVDDAVRKGKQTDFDLFGRSLGISTRVEVTPELLEAADAFLPYRILAEDVRRAAAVANEIVRDGGRTSESGGTYQVVEAEWLSDVFAMCDDWLSLWLTTWQQLVGEGSDHNAADVRKRAGLPLATLDDFGWSRKGAR